MVLFFWNKYRKSNKRNNKYQNKDKVFNKLPDT